MSLRKSVKKYFKYFIEVLTIGSPRKSARPIPGPPSRLVGCGYFRFNYVISVTFFQQCCVTSGVTPDFRKLIILKLLVKNSKRPSCCWKSRTLQSDWFTAPFSDIDYSLISHGQDKRALLLL